MANIAKIFFCLMLPLVMVIFACKSTQIGSTPFYDDVSQYRISFPDMVINFEDPYSPDDEGIAFKEPKGTITAELEEKLDLLSRNANVKVTKMEGFRIQAYSGLSREDALKIRQQFQELYPSVKVEYVYRQPNHKIMIGNYLTKVQAYKFYTQIKDKFPASIVISELVNFDRNEFIK